MSACLFPISFTIAIFAASKELGHALTLSWALCTLEVRLANLTLSGAKLCILPLPFSYPLPYHSFLSLIFPGFPLFHHGPVGQQCLSLSAVCSSDAEVLLDTGPVTHLPSNLLYPFQSQDLQGKVQPLTLCHYPL